MKSESEILEKMSEVLNESKWDNLLINLGTGRSIEFASHGEPDILYNIANIDEPEYIEDLEQKFNLETVSRGDQYITLARDNDENVKKYLDEIENLLEVIDSSREDISTMEIRNIRPSE